MNRGRLTPRVFFGYAGILIFLAGLIFFPVFQARLIDAPEVQSALEHFNPRNTATRNLSLLQLGQHFLPAFILSMTGLAIVAVAGFINYREPALTWVCGICSLAIPFLTLLMIDIIQNRDYFQQFQPESVAINWLGITVMAIGGIIMSLSAFQSREEFQG